MRTFVVGDIHGGLKALVQVLERTPYSKKDRFIFLGDYVDGWSDSAPVISFLLKFSEHQKCIFLRGNHDELLTGYLETGEANPMWLEHGGVSGKESYDALSENDKQHHILFFRNLENYFIDKKNRLFCHAGFANIYGPEHEYYSNTVYWDRTLWEMVCSLDPSLSPEDSKYPKRLKNFKEIYIGHTPTTKIDRTVPTNFANVWNIDTGAAFLGPLTILDIDSKEFWQSDAVAQLYPNEKGRNK
ncbi:serine/threonine protein phosphatase [unidentified eubacterium SCB49]|nr:serine/threonine protein phosphatase [unidentified eubacterium SCB49]